jgi:hypothetical protein
MRNLLRRGKDVSLNPSGGRQPACRDRQNRTNLFWTGRPFATPRLGPSCVGCRDHQRAISTVWFCNRPTDRFFSRANLGKGIFSRLALAASLSDGRGQAISPAD